MSTSTNASPATVTRKDFLVGAAGLGAAAALCGNIANADEAVVLEASKGLAQTGYQCEEDWLGEAPQIADPDIVETVDVDVVVCGGGHAGSQCALAAAQAGAKVALLEVQNKDEYTANGVDICGYNSQLLTDRGLGGYDTGEIVAEFVRRGAGRVNADIIRSFVENSGEMIDNLVAITPETSNMWDFESGQVQV